MICMCYCSEADFDWVCNVFGYDELGRYSLEVEHGFTVLDRYKLFTPGSSKIDRLDHAMERSRRMVVILSRFVLRELIISKYILPDNN